MLRWSRTLVVGLILLAAVGTLPGWTTESGGALPAGILEELESSIRAEWQASEVPGLVYAVVQGDQVVDLKAMGMRKKGGTDAVDEHTVFQIGSASKAFTATMLAMVVEEGKLSWDDRVADHLPQFRMHDRWVTREMRVGDLVCQRSGLPTHALDNMSAIGFTRQDIIRALRFVEPVSSFRSAYAYQNNMWLVAAALVEQKTGFTWEDNLDRRIFGPLGMVESTTSPEVAAAMPNAATGHFWVPIEPEPPQEPKTELQPVPEDWPWRVWLDVLGPAGSIRSTVADLVQWVRLQINLGVVGDATLLKPTTVALLHAPRTLNVGFSNAAGDVFAYASGWVYTTSNRHPIVWHNGGTHGMHSIVGYLPEAGVGLVMLTNEVSNLIPEHALMKLADLVLGQPAGTTVAPEQALGRAARPPARRLEGAAMGPPLPLDRYVGTYTNPAYGRFVVRVTAGRLEMVFGPACFVGVLQPVSGNTFRMPWPAYPSQVSTITFTVPTGQPAVKMTVTEFEDVNGGVFVRAGSGSGH